MLLYKREQRMVPDNCTKYKQNHHILLQDITITLNIYEKLAIITQTWHRAKFYVTSISGPWYLHIQYEENPSSHHERMSKDG